MPDGAAPKPLELRLGVPDGPSSTADALTITLELVNRGDAPLIVNRRMLVAPPGTPEAFHEVTVDVEGPPGYVNRKAAVVTAGRARRHDFAELAPGAAVAKEFPLTRLHSLHVPGSYSLRATYRNTADPGVLERTPWRGEVLSDPCVVERA